MLSKETLAVWLAAGAHKNVFVNELLCLPASLAVPRHSGGQTSGRESGRVDVQWVRLLGCRVCGIGPVVSGCCCVCVTGSPQRG
jgi:hypothetical protein